MPKISAVIVAGGTSERMGEMDKLFLPLGGMTVLERSIAAFDRNALITEIVVSTARGNIEKVAQISSRYPKVRHVVEGGRTRYDSVQSGVAHCSKTTQYYAIHDAARPFVSDELISNVIRKAIEKGAAAPALPVTDTIKVVEDGLIQRTPDRNVLYAVATPQVFEAARYRAAAEGQSDVFDDCQLMERAGYEVSVIEGESTNMKITNPEDIERARQIAGVTDMRVGQGYDVHRLAEGHKLVLGGVQIRHDKGLAGHSDADVLVHAVIDALLGACALGNIGILFPDSDERYAGINSLKLLKEAVRHILDKGFVLCNIDATIICQQPKLAEYFGAMQKNIAQTAGMELDKVSIKATTEEGLGFTGNESGIAAQAVALVRQKLI